MRTPATICLFALSFCIGVRAQPPKAPKAPPALRELQSKIDNTIHRGVDALLRAQQADGTWAVNQYGYPVGPTALCTYALIKCGLETDHPAVARSLRFLEHNLSEKTYGAACQLMAFEATKDKRYRPQMKELLGRLLEWQRGGWGYPHGQVDLSNTQYGALGLRAARLAGLSVPRTALLKLIDYTFQHQTKSVVMDVPADPFQQDGYERGGGQGNVAGFSYRPAKTDQAAQKATGSMTTAGLGILLICEELLEKKMGRNRRKKLNLSMERGLNWMRVNWRVNSNPGGGHHLYYLYGLERVGDLMRREVMAGHYWYREGAAHLVKSQTAQGQWGGMPDTSFGLLFLKRATWIGAVTGARGTDRTQRVYLAAKDQAEVELRGAGNPNFSVWIAGFSQKKLEKRFPKQKGKRAVRVASVEYLIDGKVVHRHEDEEQKIWDGKPFGYKHRFKRIGRYNVAARVHVQNPNAGQGDEADTVILESPILIVEVLDLPDPERDALGSSLLDNKLRGNIGQVTASSIERGWGSQTPWVVDGRLATAWLCKPDDKNPWIKIKPRRSMSVREIIIWPNQTQGKIKRIELMTDGGIPRVIELDNPRRAIQLAFKRRRNIRKLEIRITEVDAPEGKPRKVGFAEVIFR